MGTMGCPHRGRELEGTLKLHEFIGEAEELRTWLASQKQAAGLGESLGEDHEHILVSRIGLGGHPQGEGGGEGQWAGPKDCGGEGCGSHECWPRTGLLRRCRQRGLPHPSLPNQEAPASQAACCLPGGSLCHPLPSCPQHLCTEFTRFQQRVELGARRVAACRQLAESLQELGHRAAPDARQTQQHLQ